MRVLVLMTFASIIVWGARWVWACAWRCRDDLMIEDLIAANRARPRAGMDQVDWRRLNQLGQRRWAEVEAAQQRLAGTANHAPPRYRLVRR